MDKIDNNQYAKDKYILSLMYVILLTFRMTSHIEGIENTLVPAYVLSICVEKQIPTLKL